MNERGKHAIRIEVSGPRPERSVSIPLDVAIFQGLSREQAEAIFADVVRSIEAHVKPEQPT